MKKIKKFFTRNRGRINKALNWGLLLCIFGAVKFYPDSALVLVLCLIYLRRKG